MVNYGATQNVDMWLPVDQITTPEEVTTELCVFRSVCPCFNVIVFNFHFQMLTSLLQTCN
jgi:hypothetical protein